ncbi:protein of unknown function [Rhodovastum atsumiense]|nr:protein of unknown function [Rhodovastum atsumiense]
MPAPVQKDNFYGKITSVPAEMAGIKHREVYKTINLLISYSEFFLVLYNLVAFS